MRCFLLPTFPLAIIGYGIGDGPKSARAVFGVVVLSQGSQLSKAHPALKRSRTLQKVWEEDVY